MLIAKSPDQIIAEIEAEQALVATSRELIARFEKKIQGALARVWGEKKKRKIRNYELQIKN